MKTQVTITAEKIRGNCPIYKTGDKIIINNFYIKSKESSNICIRAFAAMKTLLFAFLHGPSVLELGIGLEEDVGFLQCSDNGMPYPKGGTVFKLKRVATK